MRNGYLNYAPDHIVAESTNLLATTRGAHIFSVKANDDIDNGKLVSLSKASCIKSETVAGATVKSYTREYFTMVEPTDSCHVGLILSVAIGADERPKKFTDEKAFYNADGELMRVYDLAFGDRFTVSANGITNTPEVGKYVVADGYDISAQTAAPAATVAFYGEIIDKITRNQEVFYEILVRKNA